MKACIISLLLLMQMKMQMMAQSFRYTAPSTVQEVSITDLPGNVDVRGVDGDEIIVSLVDKDKSEHPTPLTANTTDASAAGISLEFTGAWINIQSLASAKPDAKYIIDLPARFGLHIKGSSRFIRSLFIKGMKGRLDIDTEKDVLIKDLSSGLILKNSSGKVTVTVTKNLKNPVSIITENGSVALAVPLGFGVNLKIGSGTGNIAAMMKDGKGSFMATGKFFASNINGGGPAIQAQALGGDIFVSQY